VTPPAALRSLLAHQTRTLGLLAQRSSGATRRDLLGTAARFAEYAGWIEQEAGDRQAALRLTGEAVAMAEAAGDTHLADYALVRRALVTFYDRNARETIALAERAQRSGAPPRVRGLAAQREAQGHALAGDESACRRALERARPLLAEAPAEDGAGPLGPTHLADTVSMITGWCLYDLGRPREAARLMDRECRRIPATAVRTRTRYGLRRALALAAAGEIEESCAVARELLPLTVLVPSATVRTDVRRLDRELARFRTHRTVRDLHPALADALNSA
jgi:hypothetical protein